MSQKPDNPCHISSFRHKKGTAIKYNELYNDDIAKYRGST
jgi:hypothetical protein